MSLNPDSARRIGALISSARRIQIVTHVAPDGDAIGSLLGLGWWLRARGKQVARTCADPVPDNLLWLPGSDEILTQGPGAAECDLLISLDCSDPRRMGAVFGAPGRPRHYSEAPSATPFRGLGPLLNIDHHVTNTLFGTENWVDPGSVATAQMVLELGTALGWALDPTVAVCLLTGLVTDTRSFRTANVDAAAMQAALRLMEAGAPLHEITHRTLEQRPLPAVRLWGEAIDRLQLEDEILWTEVTRAMTRRFLPRQAGQGSPGEDGTTGLTNFLSGVREAKVVVVFTERGDGTIDVGMRAEPGWDVAQVALDLGGGGHPQASGCTLEGTLESVRDRVLAAVRHSLAAQRRHRAGTAAPGNPALATQPRVGGSAMQRQGTA